MPADVYDLLPDGVVVADGDGIVLMANEPARRMLGDHVVPGAELAAAMVLQDQEGHDWFTTVRPFEGIASRVGVPEQAWFTPDGTELLVNTRMRRAGRGGRVDRVAIVLRSARGRTLLDRERSDLVATVAHELRSPLTGVKGFVTTLLNRWDRLNDEQKKLMLTTVHADAERLSRLITELLDVARIDTGRLPLYPRDLEVGKAVEHVVEAARAATTREIVIEHADPAATVYADPDKLAQVLGNLVENAIRHGEGVVTIRTRPVADPMPAVEIVVDDEGEGIAEELRTRVFTKFWRAGIAGGSGLGMYIVSGLTKVHGGTVAILDAPSGGARLRISWPTGPPDETGSSPAVPTS